MPKSALMAAQQLISVGINDDWSFEQASTGLNPALRLTGVDATTTPWYVLRRGFRFRVEYLLAWVTGRRAKTDFLKTRMPSVSAYRRFWAQHTLILKMLAPHTSATTVCLAELMKLPPGSTQEAGSRVFLKMDIEGAEYALLDDIVSAAPRLTGLAMELHDLPAHRDRVIQFCAALRPHLVLVHLHANTYDGVDPVTALPKVVEATWVSRRLAAEGLPATQALPRPGLDQPSKYSHQPVHLYPADDAAGVERTRRASASAAE
ncbi:MAG: hypothetical protein ACKOD9_10520 [Rubrivivax sp.]